MDYNIIDFIIKKINKDEIISPCLFLGKNEELLNIYVRDIAIKLVKIYNIPVSYIYVLENNWKNIKINDIREFLEFSNSDPGYKFQIFIIENISRFTLNAINTCLKFFEEPWNNNIIFLTNNSESWVLETILSRVQIVNTNLEILSNKNEFYYSLIKNFKKDKKIEIFSYFYNSKLDKKDYLIFLENLLLYSKENFEYIELLDELNDDINAIKQNNISPKYIIDKYILKISK